MVEVRPVKVYYKCDHCNKGIVELIDKEFEKDDDGETHIVYTYKCPICGIIDSLYDIKYPYIKYVDTDIIHPISFQR